MKKVLVITTNTDAFEKLRGFFRADYKVDYSSNTENCFQKYRHCRYELIFIDLKILRADNSNGTPHYKQELQPFWQVFPSAEIIVLTSPEMIREAVQAVKAGIDNYLTYPVNLDELKYVTESINEARKIEYELDYLRDRFWQSDSFDLVRTNSSSMQEVFQKAKAAAPTKTTVLLFGETGTGKGVIARLLHRHSQRSEKQFIAVHCGSMPDNLIESELFGHEKGSFTGAIRRKLGKFEIAKGGTLFLDEIGTITPAVQIKLLQVLQEHTYQRVGGEEILEADARIIAATNVDLKKLCDEGVFRSDLYFRLNVFPIEIPPLRERVEDIPLLVEHFLKTLNQHHTKNIYAIHPQVMEAFQRYSWPGNIREMENLMERAYILEPTSILMPDRFPSEIFTENITQRLFRVNPSLGLADARRLAVEQFEKSYLSELLTLHRGRIDRTAAAAGISVRQLHKLLTRYGIHKEEFK